MSQCRLRRWPGRVTLLEGLQAGIAGQLTVLDDVDLTGTGQSSADVLDARASVLAQTLTGHLVCELSMTTHQRCVVWVDGNGRSQDVWI